MVRVAHNAILVSRMHLATIALLCKQTTDNFQTHHSPEPKWRHLSGNRILFVPHYQSVFGRSIRILHNANSCIRSHVEVQSSRNIEWISMFYKPNDHSLQTQVHRMGITMSDECWYTHTNLYHEALFIASHNEGMFCLWEDWSK